MIVSPIGSFLTRIDAGMSTAMSTGITGLTSYAAKPVMLSMVVYYIIQGVTIAKGEGAPVSVVTTGLIRNAIILWFCSNATTYNTWVRDFFFTSLPGALNTAVLSQTGAGTIGIAGGVNSTAAAFDQIWALMNVQVAAVYAHADFLDVSSKLGAQLCSLTGGLGLLVIAMVYLLSRIILAVVIELGVCAIACLIFKATSPIFERWLGKVIALVFLQVAAIVVLQLVITTDQEFIKQITASNTGGDVVSELQGLVAIVLMFFMGAFAVYSLPAIAYSIGTGVSVSLLPPMLMAMAAVRAISTTGGGAAAGAEAAGLEMSLPPSTAMEASFANRATSAIGPSAPTPPPLSLTGF